VDTDFIGQNVYLFCAAVQEPPTPKVARAARQVKDLARAVRRKAGRVGRGPREDGMAAGREQRGTRPA
jgi:hypothetical protein